MAVRTETLQVTGIRCERCVHRLAGGFEAPDTEGYGETVRDDPAFGDQATAAAERERVALREGETHTDDVAAVRGRSSPNALQPAETPPTDDGVR